MNIGWWIYFFSNEFRWWACELLCSFLLPSEGVPACCDCCASLASLYTSHTPSMSFYEIVSIFYWTPNINPFFCLCVLCASVSVSCVLLPRNCRRRRAWCYGLNRWLWLVMAGYEVLFGIRNRIWTLCRRPGRSRTTLKQYFWMTPQANGPMCKDFGQSFSEEINFEGQRLKNLYNIMFKQFDLSFCHRVDMLQVFSMKTVVESKNQKRI